MSRIGIGDENLKCSKCLGCKRYKKASKTPRYIGIKEYGRCTLGYCEKIQKR